MFYTEVLTREKIKAGKYIIKKLLDEGWDVQAAAWLLHGDTPEPDEWYPGYESTKYWCLSFVMSRGAQSSEDWAFGRVAEIQKAYIDELYDDALYDDYFSVSVISPGESLGKALLELRSVEHPLGERVSSIRHWSRIEDSFVYNLGSTPEQKKTNLDSLAD